MTRRKLSPEEISLWRRVADNAERLHPKDTSRPHVMPKPKPTKQPSATNVANLVGQHPSGKLPHQNLKSRVKLPHSPAAVQMDQKKFGRMKRGRLAPEGRVDLHGMTLDRAQPALIRFILTSQAKGKRLVLVITGKGKQAADDGPIPVPRGILRHNVPIWLSMPPLAQAVLQVAPAHVSHGGGGAFYVYLRKGR